MFGIAFCLATFGQAAAILDVPFPDDNDEDVDGYSDKLEVELLKTNPDNNDSDGDQIRDARDLLPMAPVDEIQVNVHVIKIEAVDDCDPNIKGYFDPYIADGGIEIATDALDRAADFTRTGMTKGTHPHNKVAYEPDTAIFAQVDIPTDLNLFSNELGVRPAFTITFGLYDHDVPSADDPVRLMPNFDTLAASNVPIYGLVDRDDPWSVRYKGSGSNCDGAIYVRVDSALKKADVVAAVLKQQQGAGFITMEDVEDEMNGNGVCSPSFLLAEDSCFPVVDARGEGVLDLANSRGDQQSDALDAAELADTSEGEHTLWHHVSQPPDLSFAASGELVPYLSMEPALSPQSQGDSAEAVRVSAFDRDGHVVASSDARVDYGSLLANAVLALPGLELPVGTVVDHLSVELLAGAEEGSPVVRSEKINVGHGFFLAGARDRILVELGRSLGTSSAFATWDSADGPSQFNAYVAGRPHALRLASAREFGSLALETHAQGLEYAEMGEHLLAVGGVSSGASLLQLAAELRELERSYYALRDFNAGTWERSEA